MDIEMKTLVIPLGFERQEVSEDDIRKAQTFNIKNLSTKEGKVIDAVLSYFALNCLTSSSGSYSQQTHKKISNL